MFLVPKSHHRHLIIASLVFSTAILSRGILFGWAAYEGYIGSLPEWMGRLEQPLRWLVFCWLGLYWAHRAGAGQSLSRLGLSAPIGKALIFSFLACSPMLIGSLLFGQFNSNLQLSALLFSAAIWPLAEEILFRGYFFGQIHRDGKVGIWWAAAVTGVIFGLLHLGQASVQQLPLSGEVGTVLLVGVGGTLYAWLFVKWNFNLWVPFGMHLFMNGWWEVFEMAANPLGGWFSNALRLATVLLAILLTVYQDRISIFASASRLGQANHDA